MQRDVHIEARLAALLAEADPDPDALARAYLDGGAALARARSDPAESWREGGLEVLVGRAHARLFRAPIPTRARALRFVTRTWPTLVWRQRWETASAAGIFAAAALLTGLSVAAWPGAAARILPAEVLYAIEARRGAALWMESSGALEAAGLFAHNAQAAVEACALGALFGLGSIWSLARNGAFTGGVIAAAWLQGDGATLGRFMLTHGGLEFPAIFLSGGAGLRLGRALMGPGSRRAALREEAGHAARVMLGALALVGLAALIEGMISPGVGSLGTAVAIGGCCLAGLIVWVGRGRRGEGGATPDPGGAP